MTTEALQTVALRRHGPQRLLQLEPNDDEGDTAMVTIVTDLLHV